MQEMIEVLILEFIFEKEVKHLIIKILDLLGAWVELLIQDIFQKQDMQVRQ